MAGVIYAVTRVSGMLVRLFVGRECRLVLVLFMRVGRCFRSLSVTGCVIVMGVVLVAVMIGHCDILYSLR